MSESRGLFRILHAVSLFRKPVRLLNRLALKAGLTRRLTRSTLALERLGSDYGGWFVPAALLNEYSLCYAAGVGEDITFDLALIRRFGCPVFAFDPTPRSAAYVRTAAADVPSFRFFPIGLWSEKRRMKFFAPKNPSHVSHSIVNLQETDDYFEADCDRLSNIMRANGHARLDLLKMDIEGAEMAVLETILADRPSIGIIAVEFDQPAWAGDILRMTDRLLAAGYALVSVDGWNFTFVERALLAASADRAAARPEVKTR